MQVKRPLQVNYGAPDFIGEFEERMAQELEARFDFGRLLRRWPEASKVIAYIGCHPGILAEPECAFEHRVFANAFARLPDSVIEALQFVRRRYAQHHERANGQTVRLKRFFRRVEHLYRKGRRLLDAAELTASDFIDPASLNLRPAVKKVRVAELSDKEIAEFLSKKGDAVTADSVKKVRQSLSVQRDGNASANSL